LLGSEGANHVRLLTGSGLEFDLCCRDCGHTAQAGDRPELFTACEGCLTRCTDGWDYTWLGEAGIRDRPEPISSEIYESRLPAAVADIAPASGETGSVWLLLTHDGHIGRFNVPSEEWEVVAQASVPDEPDHDPWCGHVLRRRLHASPCGHFAAVVNDYGHHGQVIDLRTGMVTCTLHGGDYHEETVPFSVAFADHDGTTVVIHRADWNRLDVSDAATGDTLTSRGPTSYRRDEQRPEHYLDYFHGGLAVSPDGRWIADDGWVWHPVGILSAWDLRRWMAVNPWESEDGPSLQSLCQRWYHWDSPMCWISESRIAVSGIGDDDEALLPGVRVFDVTTGAEVSAFALPEHPASLFSDGRRLYAAGSVSLGVWDPVTGERTGTVLGFSPSVHQPAAGELAAFDGQARILQFWPTPGSRALPPLREARHLAGISADSARSARNQWRFRIPRMVPTGRRQADAAPM
jgi:hypothetical protein